MHLINPCVAERGSSRVFLYYYYFCVFLRDVAHTIPPKQTVKILVGVNYLVRGKDLSGKQLGRHTKSIMRSIELGLGYTDYT